MIEFPGLGGLSFNIDPVAFKIGVIPVYWYGIIIASAFMLAVLLGMRHSSRFGIDPENLVDMVLFAAPVAIVCARLYYVIFSWENYKDDPAEIFKIWHGGLAIYGGIIGSVLVVLIYTRAKKMNLFKVMDFVSPYIVLAQGIGRWGNFVNQEAFGTNTALPWGMTGDQIRSQLALLQMQGMNVNPELPVHPTFFYESLWDIAVFALLIFYRKRKKAEGEIFSLYMILYSAGRVWIEGLRTDSLMLGNIRISQVLSVIFIIAFIILMVSLRRKASEAALAEVEAGSSEYAGVLKRLAEEEAEAGDAGMEGAGEEGAVKQSDGEESAGEEGAGEESAGEESTGEEGAVKDNDSER